MTYKNVVSAQGVVVDQNNKKVACILYRFKKSIISSQGVVVDQNDKKLNDVPLNITALPQ